jgi:hypothetical protein
VVSAEQWKIALHRHPAYVPERKALMVQGAVRSPELSRAYCEKLLQKGGFSSKEVERYTSRAQTRLDFYALERAGQLLQVLKEEQVLPHAAVQFMRTALELGAASGEGQEMLDWCEIAAETCRQKKQSGQALKNPAGLLMKIIRDPEMRRRVVPEGVEISEKKRFRQREEAVLRQEQQAEERILVLEYEQFCRNVAKELFNELPDGTKASLRSEKGALLSQYERFQRLPAQKRAEEVDELILQDLAKQAPIFDKWVLRKRAQQAVLPFGLPDTSGLPITA